MEQIQFISTSPEELATLISEAINLQLQQLKSISTSEEPEYLSRKRVAEMLGCHISTIDNLCDKKILIRYQIGGMVRLRSDQVENAMVKLK